LPESHCFPAKLSPILVRLQSAKNKGVSCELSNLQPISGLKLNSFGPEVLKCGVCLLLRSNLKLLLKFTLYGMMRVLRQRLLELTQEFWLIPFDSGPGANL